MITRTFITATVQAQIAQKEDTGIYTETITKRLEQCDTRAKAEVRLHKMFPAHIVAIQDISFQKTVRVMTDEVFIENSVVNEVSEMTEQELLDRAESRKRGK